MPLPLYLVTFSWFSGSRIILWRLMLSTHFLTNFAPLPHFQSFVNWSKSWFAPYSRIETPTSGTISQVLATSCVVCGVNLLSRSVRWFSRSVVCFISTLSVPSFFFGFVRPNVQLTTNFWKRTSNCLLSLGVPWMTLSGALFTKISFPSWPKRFVFLSSEISSDLQNAREDRELAQSLAILRTVPLSKFDIRKQYWLENDPLPYGSAVTALRNLPKYTSSCSFESYSLMLELPILILNSHAW